MLKLEEPMEVGLLKLPVMQKRKPREGRDLPSSRCKLVAELRLLTLLIQEVA